MMPTRKGWINHAEVLLFCLSAGEKFTCGMQQFFIQKSYLFYILSAFCYNIFAFFAKHPNRINL